MGNAEVVTVKFTNSMDAEQIARFIITTDKAIYRQQSRQHSACLNRGRVVTAEDDYNIFGWDDPASARVEKLAALEAGVREGEPFYFIQIDKDAPRG